uniref:DNA-directed DNA polymerase n=1 Tax=Tanacetum cinerariifolium TaxID=118510 RepID=A0A6L2MFI4_TANCI|nr:DNA-directed DNA polymerase [Tanacetum cinerariifolium]
MPFSMYKRLRMGKLEPIDMIIEMGDNTKRTPKGIGNQRCISVGLSHKKESGHEYWASSDPHGDVCDGGDSPYDREKCYWESTNDSRQEELAWEELSLNDWMRIRRSNRRRIPNIVEPEIRTIEEIVPMADRTMEELLQSPTEGDVSNDAIKLMLFPYSLEGAARVWYEKEPPNSILTWDDLETFGEAWDRFKEMLRACPHHGFSELTQIDTFYNGLTEQHQDSLNAAAGGNLLNKTTREALKIIKNKSKVHYSRRKSNVSRVNTNSRDNVSKTDDRIDKLADYISNLVETVNKQVIAPAKAVEKTCVACGGAHAYYDCIATDSNQPSVCAATGSYNQVSSPNRDSHQIPPPGFAPVQNNSNRFNQNQVPNNQIQPSVPNEFSSYMKSNEIMIKSMQNQINVLRSDFNKQEGNLRRNLNNDMRNILGSFFQNQPSTSGTLPSNTVPNPKGEMKAVTTRSGLDYEGPSIPTNSPLEKVDEQNTEEIMDKEHSNCPESTAQVQPPVLPILISKLDVSRTQSKPTIPYPSSLLANKDKLFELAKVLLNENCSAMLLKKLSEKLGDPGKFLIPCDFSGMEVCHVLADLGASINLMPLSIWKKLSLPELAPTRMTLELADRSITRPKGVAEDVFVKVGKFHFPTDYVVVDFEADPRVPLILGRSFLRTGRALIDVYGEEITLRYENHLSNLCGNNSHDGYDYQQQFSFVYEHELSYNQNYDGNYYSYELQSFPCCDNYGKSDETFQCQPITFQIDFSGSDHIQTPQYPEIHSPSSETSDEVFQANHSVQNNESFKNPSNEIAVFNSNQEKEEPPRESDICQLIREECCVEANEEQKQSMEDTMLELVKICQEKEFLCIHNDVDDLIESTLNSKLLLINSNFQHLDKKEQEVKNVVEQQPQRGNHSIQSLQIFRVVYKSSISFRDTSQISSIHTVAPILSTKEPEHLLSIIECEVTLEDKKECDLPISENSPVCDNHSDIFFDSKVDDDISVYDDDFEDIEYVEATLFDPENVSIEEENSVEEENVVQQEEEEIDLEGISQIQDVVLREKLLSIIRLISNIESLNDNSTIDRMFNSFESDNSLLDNFSPEFETFCDHTEETRSGNTTHADHSLPEYDSFCFEIEPDQERLINLVENDILENSTNNSLLEEADLLLSDDSIPPGIENTADDPEGDIRFLEELLIDDSILSHESSDSNFEKNLSIPRPPPEPLDAETDEGEKTLVVMNDKDKFDDDYQFFMFDKEFSLLSVESEDMIFDPGISE